MINHYLVHPHHTRSWISRSTSFSPLDAFFCGCWEDTLYVSVVLWYCLFLRVLSSWILSNRGLVRPSNKPLAIDTYFGSSFDSATHLASPSPPWLRVEVLFDLEQIAVSIRTVCVLSSFLSVNSRFQLFLNARSSSSAIFKHKSSSHSLTIV